MFNINIAGLMGHNASHLNFQGNQKPNQETFVKLVTDRVKNSYKETLKTKIDEIVIDWFLFFIEKFEGPKSGDWYPRWPKGPMYQASAEGEYPATKTGNFLEELQIYADHYEDYSTITLSGPDYAYDLTRNAKQGGNRLLFKASKDDFFAPRREDIMEDMNKNMRKNKQTNASIRSAMLKRRAKKS